MVAYKESPLDRIVNVNFGGGPIIVAKVAGAEHYLLSLNPKDPEDSVIGDERLTYGGAYDENKTIEKADYTGRPIPAFANLYNAVPNIDGIALDTSAVRGTLSEYLKTGERYPIQGAFISANTTMLYNGGGTGTLSANPVVYPGDSVFGSPVTIRIKIWQFSLGVRAHYTDGTSGILYDENYTIEGEWGDHNYISSPLMLAQISGTSDSDRQTKINAAYADFLAQGYPAYALFTFRTAFDPYNDPFMKNGVNVGPWPWSIWQFFGAMTDRRQIYLINMANTKLVQVLQMDFFNNYYGSTEHHLRGWIAASTLTAYSSGTKFSLQVQHGTLGGWSGDFPSLILNARTAENVAATPMWTVDIPLATTSPDVGLGKGIEVARFDVKGLVVPAP